MLKNIFKINKKIIPLIAIFSFIILNVYISYTYYAKYISTKDILRLHVVANSNSIDDQIIKLKVNEKITEYIKNLNLDNLGTEQKINILKEKSSDILQIANNTLKNENKNYTSKIEVGKINYNAKDDMIYHMDKGTYNSAKIILGNGNGKNIWGFICPNSENLNKLKYYETIIPGISKFYSSNNDTIEYKSKIMEFLKYYNF